MAAAELVLDPDVLEQDEFVWTDELRGQLLPSSFEDFVLRRSEILHRNAFPLYVVADGSIPKRGFLGELPWLSPPGPDFITRIEQRAGIVLDPIPLTGLKDAAKEYAIEENARRVAEYRHVFDFHLEYLYVRALYDPEYSMKVGVKGRYEEARFVSGTFTTPNGVVYGPRRADVLICGKCPGLVEVDRRENFVGPASKELARAYRECQIPESAVAAWYYTNLVKHQVLNPASNRLESAWLTNCKPLLDLELRLVQPKYALCFGSEAAQKLIDPKANVTRMYGRVVEKEFDSRPDMGEPPRTSKTFFMSVIHPASVLRDPKGFPDLANGIGVFYGLLQGERSAEREFDVNHVCIYTERHLRQVVDSIIAESTGTDIIAVDCEWHGDRAQNTGSYLRTIQFSHKPKHAYCVVLKHKGGKAAFLPDEFAARTQLLRLFKSTKDRTVRIGGHLFSADYPWLKEFGIDVLPEYTAAKTWQRTKDEGGWDTVSMAHAFQESIEGGYKLENLAARLVHVPRYDIQLQEWKDRYCTERGLKAKDLDGYGECPDAVLHPYALYDVDATIRLFHYFNGLGDTVGTLDCDTNGRSCRKSFWLNHIPRPAQLEMEAAGLQVDKERGALLTQTFIKARDTNLETFRKRIGWDTFNYNSVDQCREILFGTALNGKIDKVTGKNVRLRPKGVRALNLTPIKASGNKAPMWDKVVAEGLESKYGASTDKESLGILANFTDGDDGDTVRLLRDLRFTGQVLKGVLREPTEMGGEYVLDDEDQLIYDGGLLYWVGSDGRVRTHFGVVETARWSSWNCNLQNISKRRESDYKRILGELYRYPIRSILRAREGCVFVEADYKMAEMAAIGWLAGDETMIEMVIRNTLKEDDPNFIDLHSLTAIEAFKLDTPENHRKLEEYNKKEGKQVFWSATKALLEALGYASLRVAAKNVNFGVPYQRSAEAIARQCREEGANVTVAEAQQLIDNYYKTYAKIGVYLDACMARIHNEGWLCGAWGDHRRFAPSSDRTVLAEMERQACNFPIQNLVARAVNLACRNLYNFKAKHTGPERFTMVLQIHDALLFEVPYDSVEWLIDTVLPKCMRDNVNIYPRDLDGNRVAGGPYHLDIDCTVERWWGEKLDREWGLGVGLPEVTKGGHRILPKPKKVA